MKNSKTVYREREDKILLIAIFIVAMITIPIVLRLVYLVFSYGIDRGNFWEVVFEMISAFASLLATVALVIELNKVREIQEADFVTNLNRAFVENSDYQASYEKLEKLMHKDSYEDRPKLMRVKISNYLTFFETIYLLLLQGSVRMDTIDDLFSYRFFLAVHCPELQEIKLVSDADNFKNIFKLEKMWIEYRKKEGKKLYFDDNSLEKAIERKIKKENPNKNSEELRLLCEKKYKELTC